MLVVVVVCNKTIRCTFRFRCEWNANLLPIHFRYDLNFVFLHESFTLSFPFYFINFNLYYSFLFCHTIFFICHSFYHRVFQFREISNGFHAWITSISMVTIPNEHFFFFFTIQYSIEHEPFKMSFCYAF